ncbi:hypothetical protein NL676_005291 [Syzygium grande]|nr:hypothetical protein NL676_005291 [Syzygium grande]
MARATLAAVHRWSPAPRLRAGLDYVIVEARRNRVRVILSLVNNLNTFGGKAEYIRWAQEAGENVSSSADLFFLHPMIKEYYKAYIKALVTRKNSMTGVHYFDEPAIFAWELMNEPRSVSESSAPLLQDPGGQFGQKSEISFALVDAYIRDGDDMLKKPVLFTEVGSSLHQNQQESYQRDIFFKTVYDKI